VPLEACSASYPGRNSACNILLSTFCRPHAATAFQYEVQPGPSCCLTTCGGCGGTPVIGEVFNFCHRATSKGRERGFNKVPHTPPYVGYDHAVLSNYGISLHFPRGKACKSHRRVSTSDIGQAQVVWHRCIRCCFLLLHNGLAGPIFRPCVALTDLVEFTNIFGCFSSKSA